MYKLVNIGYGSSIPIHVIIAIARPDSAPIKRKIEEAKKNGRCIELNYGRKAKAVIFTESHIILSAIQSDTIQKRYEECAAELKGGLTPKGIKADLVMSAHSDTDKQNTDDSTKEANTVKTKEGRAKT